MGSEEIQFDGEELIRAVEESQRLYTKYRSLCFWNCRRDFKPGPEDIEWVAEKLRKHGGRAGWEDARKLQVKRFPERAAASSPRRGTVRPNCTKPRGEGCYHSSRALVSFDLTK